MTSILKVGHVSNTPLYLTLRAAKLSNIIPDDVVPGIYSKASIQKCIGAFSLHRDVLIPDEQDSPKRVLWSQLKLIGNDSPINRVGGTTGRC